MAWTFVGISNVVEVTGTPHALVTTGITGLQEGDLMIACISSRIASTTSVSLPQPQWALLSEQKNNNTGTTGTALPSGLMAWCIRGSTNPSLTFIHPVAPSVAIGRIVAYRGGNAADVVGSFTTATGITAVSGAGLTTTTADDLIVTMCAGGQESAWSSFAATTPSTASGATSTSAPTTAWLERGDSLTTTGADTSLAIFDAVKTTAGATGNFTATASVSAGQVVVAAAFKMGASVGWSNGDNSNVTLSNGDKTATINTTAVGGAKSAQGHLDGVAGKYYAEILLSNVVVDTNLYVGLKATSTTVGFFNLGMSVIGDGSILIDGTTTGIDIGASFVDGDVMGVAWDSGAHKIWFRNNAGNWNGSATADPAAGTEGITTATDGKYYLLSCRSGATSNGEEFVIRTEAADLGFSGPSGFTSWMGETLTAATAPPLSQQDRAIPQAIPRGTTLSWARGPWPPPPPAAPPDPPPWTRQWMPPARRATRDTFWAWGTPPQAPEVEEDEFLPGAGAVWPVADPRPARGAWTWNAITSAPLAKPSALPHWVLPARVPWRDTSWPRNLSLALSAKPPLSQGAALPQRLRLKAVSWLGGVPPQAAEPAGLPAGKQSALLPAQPERRPPSYLSRWAMLTAEEIETATYLPGAATGFSVAAPLRGDHRWQHNTPFLEAEEVVEPTYMPGAATGFSVADRPRRGLSWTAGITQLSFVTRAPFHATRVRLQYDKRIHSFAFVPGAMLLTPAAVAAPPRSGAFPLTVVQRRGASWFGKVPPEPHMPPRTVQALPAAQRQRVTASWAGQRPPEAALAAEMPPRSGEAALPRRAARGDAASFLAPAGAIRIPAAVPELPPASDREWRITRPTARALQLGWSSAIGPMLSGSLVKPPPSQQDMSLPRPKGAPLSPAYVQGPFQGRIPGEIPPQAGGDIHTTYFGTIRVGTLGVR